MANQILSRYSPVWGIVLVVFMALSSWSQVTQNALYWVTVGPKSNPDGNYMTVWFTQYGTIAQMTAAVRIPSQGAGGYFSAIDQSHDYQVHSIEGWAICDPSGIFGNLVMIPGLNLVPPGISVGVSQPGGPGTLPLGFNYSPTGPNPPWAISEAVTLNGQERVLTLTMTTYNRFPPAGGTARITRLADPTVDCVTSFSDPFSCIANYGLTATSAFAYSSTGFLGLGHGDGLSLTSMAIPNFGNRGNNFGLPGIGTSIDSSLACNPGGSPFSGPGMMASTSTFPVYRIDYDIKFKYRTF